ncbi:MAG: hypothetical protein FWD57_09495 [Polyangiaceae bacterium]|nr:hypothetical protein [Polyangiaceae bacterium]
MRTNSLILATVVLGLALGVQACSCDGDGDDSAAGGGSGGNAGDSGTGGNGGDVGVDEDAGGDDGDGAESKECVTVTIDSIEGRGYSIRDGFAFFIAEIAPGIYGPNRDTLQLLLYSDLTGHPGPGTYDFAFPTSVDPLSCEQCIVVAVDFDGDNYDKSFVGSSGTINIHSTLDDHVIGVVNATLHEVLFVEVDEDEVNKTLTPTVGGDCISIEYMELVIEPIDGWTCLQRNYDDGYSCSCGCGIWDPDCDIDSTPNPGGKCTPEATCVNEDGMGVCVGGIPVWTCHNLHYKDGHCECTCGGWDPDCDTKGDNPTDCDPGQICVKGDGDIPQCEWSVPGP